MRSPERTRFELDGDRPGWRKKEPPMTEKDKAFLKEVCEMLGWEWEE